MLKALLNVQKKSKICRRYAGIGGGKTNFSQGGLAKTRPSGLVSVRAAAPLAPGADWPEGLVLRKNGASDRNENPLNPHCFPLIRENPKKAL